MSRSYPLAAFVALLCLGACSGPTSTQPAPAAYPWFPFKWYADKVSGKQFDHLAILLPVRLNNLKGNFITQFDLGSDATLLYENSIRNYFPDRAQFYALLDTTRRSVADNGSVNYRTTGLPLTLGPITIPKPLLRANEGDPVAKDSLYTPSEKLIGTVGADFLRGKVLVIDYPQRRMCVLDSVDAYWRARTAFVAGRLKNSRLHIPITINQRTYWALFDTGASLFPISTSYEIWRSLVASAVPTDTLVISSWGEQVPVYGAPMQHEAYLGQLKLPKSQAWFSRNQRLLDFNKSENIDALTGNSFFINNTVVLDFKNARFGVVK